MAFTWFKILCFVVMMAVNEIMSSARLNSTPPLEHGDRNENALKNFGIHHLNSASNSKEHVESSIFEGGSRCVKKTSFDSKRWIDSLPSTSRRGHMVALELVVRDTLISCGWDSVVIISDNELGYQSAAIIDAVQNMKNISMINFDISNKNPLEDMHMFEKTFGITRRTIFIVITKRVKDFMQAAMTFLNTKEQKNNLFVNLATFFIVTDNLIGNVETEYDTSRFDHVARVGVDGKSEIVTYIQTLMWRRGQERDFSDVSSSTRDYVHGKCSLFPNTRFGLNGKKLIGLFKRFRSNTVKQFSGFNESTFDGVSQEVVRLLEEFINFTTLEEPATHEDGDRMTWEDFRLKVIHSNQIDYGLSLYSILSHYNLNLSITFPIIYPGVAGAYMPKSSPRFQISQFLMDSSSSVVLAWSLCLFVLVVVIYTVLVALTNTLLGYTECCVNHVHNNASCNRKSAVQHLKPKRRTKYRQQKRNKIIEFLNFTNEMAFSLFGTMLKQNTLTKPTSLTFWPTLVTWSLMSSLLVSIFVALRVADNVHPANESPVSLEQMLSSNEFRWCVPKFMDTFRAATQMADPHTVLGRIYANAELNETFITATERLRTEKNFVVFFFRTELESEKYNNKDFKDLIIMDDVGNFPMGLVFPPNSDLQELFSGVIYQLHASGISEMLLKRWRGNIHDEKQLTSNKQLTSKNSENVNSKGMEHFSRTLFVTIILTILSIIILFLEIVVSNLSC